MDVKEARQQFDRYLKLNQMIAEKGRQLENQRIKLQKLYVELEKENRDVEALEKMSFSTLFTRLTGKMDEKREKEEQEARIVELRFKEAKRVEEELVEELQKMQDEQKQLEGARDRYRFALAQKRAALPQEKQKELENLQNELHDCEYLINESVEAIEAGREAKESVGDVIRALNSAANWGLVDMMGVDFIGDLAKHQKISEAKRLLDEAQTSLRRFQTEIADTRIERYLNLDFTSFDIVFDMMFDNVFMDFMVQSKISDAKNKMQNLQYQIEEMISNLNRSIEEKEERMKDLKVQMRTFLESA